MTAPMWGLRAIPGGQYVLMCVDPRNLWADKSHLRQPPLAAHPKYDGRQETQYGPAR